MNASRSQDYIRSLPEFDHHELVTFIDDERTGMEAFVAIHRKNSRVPSFGATRFWHYESEIDALRDALRLSRLMSYKAALAGLPCGGAKGVIFWHGDGERRRTDVLRAYADKISILKDSFITGTDVGVKQEDLALMKETAPNIIGFNDNSTEFTALGVYSAIRRTLQELFGNDTVTGRTFAIQGLGKIGSALLNYLAPEAKAIWVADISPEAVGSAMRHRNVNAASVSDIHRLKVDVFCPCAMAGAVNTANIAELSCKAVVGGANNQLESDSLGDVLRERGILYAPDYVVNAGGLIAVYDEYEFPHYDKERVAEKVDKIGDRLQNIFEESKETNRATNRVANGAAERIFNSYGR